MVELVPGQKYRQREIEKAFNYGFGHGPRGINRIKEDSGDLDKILLFSSGETDYEDSHGDEITYWGEMQGEENEHRTAYNRGLIESQEENTPIHYFYREGETGPWTYAGPVEVKDYEETKDSKGRENYKFKLQIVDKGHTSEDDHNPTLFLAPASNDSAFQHLEDTVLRGIPAGELEPFTDQGFEEEIVSVWGNKEGTKAPWEKIEDGDFLLFYHDGEYGHAAEVIGTEENEELARELWPDHEEGDPWKYIIYLAEPFRLDLSGEDIQELADYGISYPMGFQSLNDQGHQVIREQYGSIQAFLQEWYTGPVQRPPMVRQGLEPEEPVYDTEGGLPGEVEDEIRKVFERSNAAYGRPYTLKCLLEVQEDGTVGREELREYIRDRAAEDVLPGNVENYPRLTHKLFENYGVFLLEDEDRYGIQEEYREYIPEMQDLVEELWDGLDLVDVQSDLDITIEQDDIGDELHFPDGQDEELAAQITSALNAGKHIIFTGPPGTGKTELAEIVSNAVADQEPDKVTGYQLTTATADWSTFDTVGGYMPGDDTGDELEFRPGQVLRRFRDDRNAQKNELIVIDEINRADIDKAFGQLFTVLSGQGVRLPFRADAGGGRKEEVEITPASEKANDKIGDNEYIVPESWRILATMNTYDKTSLYEMSYAFMRRFAFIRVEAPELEDLSDEQLADLLGDYCDVWDLDVDSDVLEHVGSIWQATNTAVDGRKIGPAIVEDILTYLSKRGDSTGARTEAVVNYILPQLEGVRERQEIVRKIAEESAVDATRLKQVARDMLQVDLDGSE